MKLLHVNCDFCNKPFQTYDEKKTYCNDECKAKDLFIERVKSKERVVIESKKKGVKYCKCAQCWSEFESSSNRYASHELRFCSLDCKECYVLEKSKAFQIECKACGLPFKYDTWQNGKGSRMFCSERCKFADKKKEQEKLSIEKRKENMFKDRKKRKFTLSYDQLNYLAEKKRLEDEWARLVR